MKHVLSLRVSEVAEPMFMQNNAPCRTEKTVKQFLLAVNIDVVDWPAQRPDLNLIENLWKIVGEKVMARKPVNVDNVCVMF